jgi:hypothetical protein
MRLSPDERQICETLKAKDFNDRIDIWGFKESLSFEKHAPYGI